MKIIGREREIRKLNDAYESNRSEFIAIYGRRRVGKTYLVRELFNDRFTFYTAGRENIPKSTQLLNFRDSLETYGLETPPKFHNWIEAFSSLKKLILKSDQKRKIIFIDEIAWMDNQKSEFLSVLEGFWNEWASMRDDILLIICASATSWIIKKVFHNRGGLYNRLTGKINLEQFTLHECEEYVQENNLGLSRIQILSLYMVIGGVASYWAELKKGYSASQNIEELFFTKDALLRREFKALYSSLFKSPGNYIKVITALGSRSTGLSRTEIAKETGLSNNSVLGDMLEELVECGFLYQYLPFGKRKNGRVYRVIDSFSLFYFQFLSDEIRTPLWSRIQASAEYRTWCGLSYERVVLMHLKEVKRKLGIEGVETDTSCWFSDNRKLEDGERGAQIDLLIDRADNLINIVEVKWSENGEPYLMTRDMELNLQNKKRVLIEQTGTRKGIHFTLVTVGGMQRNCYSEIIQSEITLDDLFA